MRTNLVISLVLLVLTIGGGILAQEETQHIAHRYASAAAEVRVLCEMGDWGRAEETVAGYAASWEKTTPWLQILINHDDIDDVTITLARLQAIIAAQDAGGCYQACAELQENAGHIYHRDAFTLGNVL